MWLYSVSKIFDHPFREDMWVKIALLISVLINVATWVLLYYKLQPFSYLSDSGQISLHYNIYFGIDKIGNWYEAFVIPLLGIFIILLNNILAYLVYLHEKMLSYLLIGSQVVVQIILLAAGIFVILLNI